MDGRIHRFLFLFLLVLTIVVLGGGRNFHTLLDSSVESLRSNVALVITVDAFSTTTTTTRAVRTPKHLAATVTTKRAFHCWNDQRRWFVAMDMTHHNDDDANDSETVESSTLATDVRPVTVSTASLNAATNTPKTATTTATTNAIALDRILSQLTLGFPFFVVLFAMMGFVYPTTLLWINRGNIVTLLLALVMFGTGLTLQKSDFRQIWDTKVNRYSVLLGVLCQFIIMPSTAYIVGRFFFLSQLFIPATMMDVSGGTPNIASALFLGLCFVGCSPGGTASNVVTYIANANVALSVVLTSCSTFAAVVVTPLLIQLLLRNTIYGSSSRMAATASSATGTIGATPTIQISGWSLCTSTAKVVLLPIIMGMIFKTRLPSITQTLCRFTPFISVLFVSMICGGVVAQTAAPLLSSGMGTNSGLFPIILSSVLLLHMVGFLAGYIVPKIVLPNHAEKQTSVGTMNEMTARTISIEVGMQNSALAVVLARSIPNLHPMACLPGAISATVHSCLGSILAAVWRWQSSQEQNKRT